MARRKRVGGDSAPGNRERDRGRRRARNWLALAALAALAACAPQPGREAGRAHPAIVSLNPCTDAILVAVADPAQILALSPWSADPRSSSLDPAVARRFRATRGTVEEVLALRPDLVVDGTFIAPASAAAYRRLGLRLETFGIAATVAESHAQVRRLAALAGHPDRGEALVGRIDAALAAAAPRPGDAPRSAVVWQSGGIVPGQGTLIADLLARTGFTLFTAARGLGQGQQLPLERLLADPPRVLFVAAGESGGEDDRRLHHPALARLGSTARAPLDPRLLFCAGPTIARTATRLAQVRRGLAP